MRCRTFLSKREIAMNFKTAVKTCLKEKYIDFNGRASRSEYWYFVLFYIIVCFVIGIIGGFISQTALGALSVIVSLGLLLPSFGVVVRRLHDLDKRGWWIFINLIPILGGLVLLFFFVQRGTAGPNRFGPDPLQNQKAASNGTSNQL